MNFYWDTFKVDIQGSDVEAILSADAFIKNFVCVVGEFDYNAYDLPKDIMTDPKSILTGYNFKKVFGGVNEIWMNSLYIDAYRSTLNSLDVISFTIQLQHPRFYCKDTIVLDYLRIDNGGKQNGRILRLVSEDSAFNRTI